MKAQCPICNQQALTTSQVEVFAVDQKIPFKCLNPQCGEAFDLTLNFVKLPGQGVQTFANQQGDATNLADY